MPFTIYVNGVGGLGNSLFQIASAIYYKETYGGTISLSRNDILRFGTSNCFGKRQSVQKNGKNIPYTDTIFKKFGSHRILENHTIVHNHYGNKKYVPKENIDENILISGYCQNIGLFKEHLYKMPEYLNLQDTTAINYIKSKYKNIDKGICIGLRVGHDFKHMNKITRSSYITALEKLKSMNVNIDNLFIVSDVKNAWADTFNLQDIYPATSINESDVCQMYAGLMCKHYILSESTFHLWIAYLGTINNNDKTVIVFKNTALTKKRLLLDNWVQIDYQESLSSLAKKYGTDKLSHGYIPRYESIFKNITRNNLNILEIGVREGWSHLMWRDYFSNSKIYGIDNFADPVFRKNKIKKQYDFDSISIFIGDQTDEQFLNSVLTFGLDVIIDDGGHMMSHQQLSLKHLFKKLNPNGYYVIEDLHTSQFDRFLDVPDRKFSTLNLMKALESGAEEIDSFFMDEDEISYIKNNIQSIKVYNNKLCIIQKKPA